MRRRKKLSDFRKVLDVQSMQGQPPVEELECGYRFHPNNMEIDVLYTFQADDGKRGVSKTAKGTITVYDII